jgi:hypothetical protein
MVVAPASTAACTISSRNSSSVRLASSGENSTSSVYTAALLDRFDGQVDDFLFPLFELVLTVNFGGGTEEMNARLGGDFDRLAGALDVQRVAPGQAADDAVFDFDWRWLCTDAKSPLGADGETGFDDVDAHALRAAGRSPAFRAASASPRDLLAVTQGRVENSHRFHK